MTYPSIIGLNGVARAGKDTVAKILHDLYGYEVFSFSETLNDALYTLDKAVGDRAAIMVGPLIQDFGREEVYKRYSDLVDEWGYEEAKNFAGVRSLLQAMGTEVGRNLLGEDIWVEALFKKIGVQKAVITNVRFPNEAEAVWKRDGEVWEVIRPGFQPALGHVSDTALDAYRKNEYILNNGTVEELSQKVISVMDNAVQRSFS